MNQSSKDEDTRTKLHEIMIAFRREEGNGWIQRSLEHLDEAMALLNSEKQKSELAKLDELQGWIERNHLGKGFDGSDRWEYCASEIVRKIESLKQTKEVTE